ncbi:hypothetical protein Ancab_035694 [Ancistrocladus abbreviatus]
MKRFFQPLTKDGPSKKPSLSTKEGPEEERESVEGQRKEPLRFLTWNANSFLLRVKNNWPEFSKFVERLDPDIIAIQEVRMPAAGAKDGPKNQGELKDDTNALRTEKQIVAIARLVVWSMTLLNHSSASLPFVPAWLLLPQPLA